MLVKMDILIKNATIVTQNSGRDILTGDILVKDGRIASVSPSIDEETDVIIDASGKIAMPGLVNAHTHVAMTIFRGYGEGLPLQEWLGKKIWPIEAKETGEDAYDAAMLAFCEMIRGGTTSFSEMCIVGSEEIKEAAERIGIRGVVGHGLMDKVPGKDTAGQLELMEKTVYEPGLVTSAIAPHAPYTCSEELLTSSKEFARKNRLRYHMHVSETRKEVLDMMRDTGKSPFEYLDSIGVLDNDSLLVHASWVSKREIALAGKAGVSICSCPLSNLKLATGGICPSDEYDKAGANFTLGTDSAASNNSLNMFESMKICSLLQKHKYWKADILGPQKALDFATLNGAKALGFEAGAIEEGKMADVVLLERGPNMHPEHDVVANLVYSAGPANVTDVIIAGRQVMESGVIKTVNEKEIIGKAASTSEGIMKR